MGGGWEWEIGIYVSSTRGWELGMARAQFMYVGHWGIMAAGENNEKQQLRGLKKGRGKSRKLHQKPP